MGKPIEESVAEKIGKCPFCKEGSLKVKGLFSKYLGCDNCLSGWKVSTQQNQVKLTLVRVDTSFANFFNKKDTHTVEEWQIIGDEIQRRREASINIGKKLIEFKEKSFMKNLIYMGGHKFKFPRYCGLCLGRKDDKLIISCDADILVITRKYQKMFELSDEMVEKLLRGEKLSLPVMDDFIDEVSLENLDVEKFAINEKSSTNFREIMAHADLEMLGAWSIVKDMVPDAIVYYEGIEIHLAYKDQNDVLQEITLFTPTQINNSVLPINPTEIEDSFHALMKEAIQRKRQSHLS